MHAKVIFEWFLCENVKGYSLVSTPHQMMILSQNIPLYFFINVHESPTDDFPKIKSIKLQNPSACMY